MKTRENEESRVLLLVCITPGGVSAGERSNVCFSPVIPERQTLPSRSHLPLANGLSPFCSFSTKIDSSFLLWLTSGIPHCPMVWLLSSSIITASSVPCVKCLYLKNLRWVLFSWLIGNVLGQILNTSTNIIPTVSKIYWAPICAKHCAESSR